MKTISTKNLNAKVFPYILEAINSDNYGIETSTDKEKLTFLADTFMKEYVFFDNLRRYGTFQNIMKEWIMGLPSSFNIDFENYRIIEIAKEWGSLRSNCTESDEDKIIENWFNLIAAKTFQLFRKHNISVHL